MTTVLYISLFALSALSASGVALMLYICRALKGIGVLLESSGTKEEHAERGTGEEKAKEEAEHKERFKKEQDEAFGVMMNYDISTVYGMGSERK